MEKQTNDLRIRRTKEAIKEAFISLVEAKGFEVITVKDIAQAANINRGTFYAHYQDKFDLLDYYETEMYKNLYANIQAYRKIVATDHLDDYYQKQYLAHVFRFLQEHYRLVRTLFLVNNGDSFSSKFKNALLEELMTDNTDAILKEKNMLIKKEYFIAYVTSAHLGVIKEWLKRDCTDTPEEMADMLWKISTLGILYITGIKPIGQTKS